MSGIAFMGPYSFSFCRSCSLKAKGHLGGACGLDNLEEQNARVFEGRSRTWPVVAKAAADEAALWKEAGRLF
uniref:Uncharacterized protein n=1 Tax=Oryza brachyantha TaxID=4533 RepID=J3M7P3_ORYBR